MISYLGSPSIERILAVGRNLILALVTHLSQVTLETAKIHFDLAVESPPMLRWWWKLHHSTIHIFMPSVISVGYESAETGLNH